jgi:NADPH:quinone reductase-like Zn-dependent oxidoreductase
MKAMVMEAVGLANLRLKELPDPQPGPGQVLVRLRAASLNFRDVLALKGGYGSRQKSANLIPLSDGAGEVVAIGPGVRRFKTGDRVVNTFFPGWLAGPPDERFLQQDLGGMEDGVACELRVFAEEAVLPIPADMSFVEAATLPCAAVTAWNAVRAHGKAGPEDVVLTQGSGGVALFALQFAHAAGARVISLSSSAERLERQAALGARHGINYREDAEWGKTARKITQGQGVDLVVETAGAGTLKQSMRATRLGGMIALIGMVSGTQAEVNLPIVSMGSLRIHGIAVGNRQHLEQVLAACANHGIRPVIDRVMGLQELPEALARVETGQQFGKVCIEIG